MSNTQHLFAKDHAGEDRLVLIDGMALIYRAHFALIRSPRYTSSGKCTSAVFGFCNTLFDLLNREHPTHLAVAFDTQEPTHRHKVFEAYKAQREEMPEDLAEQIPDVMRLLDAMHIPILRMPGWEADDVLGTLARRAEQDGFTTYLVTPDKDYQQLVTDKTFVWKPGRKGGQYELLGVPEVKQRWQVQDVSQVVDVLGLMGDASDNVPGVPGIGEKTAQKLIAEFGSTENLLANTDQLKGKRREVLESHVDQARLSKELVTIVTDVPVDVQWDDLEDCRMGRAAAAPACLRNGSSTRSANACSATHLRLIGDFAVSNHAHAATAASGQPLLFAAPHDFKTIRDIPHTTRSSKTLAGTCRIAGRTPAAACHLF